MALNARCWRLQGTLVGFLIGVSACYVPMSMKVEKVKVRGLGSPARVSCTTTLWERRRRNTWTPSALAAWG